MVVPVALCIECFNNITNLDLLVHIHLSVSRLIAGEMCANMSTADNRQLEHFQFSLYLRRSEFLWNSGHAAATLMKRYGCWGMTAVVLPASFLKDMLIET
jgi:hypothetical protein